MAKKQYRFISEMGESTCKVCRSYHGKVFSEDKLPKLPLHPNCRCRSVLMGESSLAKEDESDMPMEKLKELNDYYEYLIFDDDGNIIGIHPRNDLRGVTIGFGHFISYKEMAEDLKLMKLAKRNLSIEEAYELLKKDLDLNSSKDKFPLPPTLSKKPKIQPKAEPEDQIITSIDPNRAYSPWDKFETPNLAAIAFGLTYA
ncbi:MAG: hypothetical protein FWF15_08180, partial [Oscillospiraceae bacterium]|nr:hypothetical protein [Oscillospiraceae bacterium]